MAKGKGKAKARGKKKVKGKKQLLRDRHYFYSAAVQSTDVDLDFFKRIYRAKRGGSFRRLREDFCGTAALAHDWVRRHPDNHAWGVDLDSETLDWGRRNYTPVLGDAADRLHLVCGNVLDSGGTRIDLVAALNFSYSVFKTRDDLGRYFRRVRRSLAPDGIFLLDAWGGFETMQADVEARRIEAQKAFNGVKIPAFTYYWDQKRFNPVDHQMTCQIHFKLRDGTKLRKAFSYDWRLWMLPELQELLEQAGFSSTEVYVEGWDDEEDDTDGVFRRKTYFENQAGWVAYVVGLT